MGGNTPRQLIAKDGGQVVIDVTALRSYQERPFVTREWEELVAELCRSNDPNLHERMVRELADIKVKDPLFKLT